MGKSFQNYSILKSLMVWNIKYAHENLSEDPEIFGAGVSLKA